ncbi:MAG TPA: DUF362 domain-containing protein [Myxococcota bacterium]|nr:DUF362 domain-containing protein [Myxococcota bacterium]
MVLLEPTGERCIERLLDAALVDLPAGASVLVKPDWNARSEPKPGENTTPELLRAVLSWLEARGVEHLSIGHSSLLTPPDTPYTSFMDLVEIAGCVELLEDFPHLKLVDLEIEPMQLQGGFLVPQALGEHDVVINCVRLKSHMGTTIAVACKGLMGLLPDSEHLRMHRDGLDVLLAELARVLPPTLSIVEADVGMEGEGPHHGTPVDCGYVLAGDDLFELDCVAARLMGVDPAEVGHLASLGETFPPLPEEFEPHVVAFERSKGMLAVTRAVRVWPGDSCATCHVAASSLLEHIEVRDLPGLAKALYVDGVDVYMGHQPADRRPSGDRCVAVGECARGFAEAHGVALVEGCPVRAERVRPALVEALTA